MKAVKLHKVAMVACLRKWLRILTAMLKEENGIAISRTVNLS